MAAPTLIFPSFTDGFVPEATGEAVAFARSEKDWKINRYCQYVPVPQPVGLFAQLGRDVFIRDVGAGSSNSPGQGGSDKSWMPGDDVPNGEKNKIPFLFQEFRCFYKFEAYRLAYDEIDLTKAFNLRLAHQRMAITMLLTDRTYRAMNILTTPGNWNTTHTNSANGINGGKGPWSTASDDPNSPAYLAIFRTLQAAARQIHLDTNGVVTQDKLQVVIGPDLAIAMSEAPELVNYCRETPQAVMLTKEGFDPQWEMWGIPSHYRGFRFVVEDAPVVTGNATLPSAAGGYPNQPAMAVESTTRAYMWPASTAVMLARIGGLDGEFGAKSYSTFQIFHYKGLLRSRAFDEPRHMRVVGDVSECIDLRIVASMSGYCITSCL